MCRQVRSLTSRSTDTNVYEVLMTLVLVLPLQLLAYDSVVLLGRNVDQPRNLAKSVTVE